MNEEETPSEIEEPEESDEKDSPTTKTDNVDNPETALQFAHLFKKTNPARSTKHPWIRVKSNKQPGIKRTSLSSFLKNPVKPS